MVIGVGVGAGAAVDDGAGRGTALATRVAAGGCRACVIRGFGGRGFSVGSGGGRRPASFVAGSGGGKGTARSRAAGRGSGGGAGVVAANGGDGGIGGKGGIAADAAASRGGVGVDGGEAGAAAADGAPPVACAMLPLPPPAAPARPGASIMTGMRVIGITGGGCGNHQCNKTASTAAWSVSEAAIAPRRSERWGGTVLPAVERMRPVETLSLLCRVRFGETLAAHTAARKAAFRD